MSDKVGDAFAEISLRTTKFDSKMNSVRQTLARTAQRFGAFARQTAVVLGAAFAAAGAFALRGAIKQQAVEKQLEVALRAHGDAVADLMPRYKQFASAIQSVTTYGDEEVLTMMSILRNFGVLPEQLQDATKATIGLAKARNLDADSAARYTALALKGQFTVLQRYVPALETATSQSDKLRIVTELMSRGFEQAMGQTEDTAGAWKQLKNSVGDFGEEIIFALSGTTNLAEALLEMRLTIETMRDNIGPTGNAIRDFGGKVKTTVQEVSALFGALTAGANAMEAFQIAVTTPGELQRQQDRRIAQIKAEIEAQRERLRGLKDLNVDLKAVTKEKKKQIGIFSAFEDIVRRAQEAFHTRQGGAGIVAGGMAGAPMGIPAAPRTGLASDLQILKDILAVLKLILQGVNKSAVFA